MGAHWRWGESSRPLSRPPARQRLAIPKIPRCTEVPGNLDLPAYSQVTHSEDGWQTALVPGRDRQRPVGAWQRIRAGADGLPARPGRRRARAGVSGVDQTRQRPLLPAVRLRGHRRDRAAERRPDDVADVATATISTIGRWWRQPVISRGRPGLSPQRWSPLSIICLAWMIPIDRLNTCPTPLVRRRIRMCARPYSRGVRQLRPATAAIATLIDPPAPAGQAAPQPAAAL